MAEIVRPQALKPCLLRELPPCGSPRPSAWRLGDIELRTVYSAWNDVVFGAKSPQRMGTAQELFDCPRRSLVEGDRPDSEAVFPDPYIQHAGFKVGIPDSQIP